MSTPNLITLKLTSPQADKLEALLRERGYKLYNVDYARISAEIPNPDGGARATRVTIYTSLKLVITGRAAADFVQFTLEPEITGATVHGYENILQPEKIAPHIGIDESGKGDYFGPVVVAAAYTDPELLKQMDLIGVRDCKMIPDTQLVGIAAKLRWLLGENRYSIVKISPQRYNELHAKIGNLNRLLAWGHARTIENLLEKVPDCPRAVVDQFAADESVVKRALLPRGKQIILEQRHKAENDIAVAAASILARDAFLSSLKELSKKYGMPIPKGAGSGVNEAAAALVRAKGEEVFDEAMKKHFNNTLRVKDLLKKA